VNWFEARGIRRVEEVAEMIEVPDIRQREDYGCGDAAIDSALGSLGLRRKPGTRIANPVQGVAPDTVAAVLRASGARVQAGEVLTGVEGLRHFTAAGLPVLCPVALYGGHWVCVRGVYRGRVHFHCPLVGPDSRRAADWLALWTDRASETGHGFDRWGIVCAP
jgi:hypothetical protein